jgi:NhaP-type Na+/H+ or K+/H+ antiporter
MDDWALPAIAVMLIAYGAVSGRLRSTPISQAMVFVTLGLLAGNQLVGLVDADMVTGFVRHLAEATLTLVLFCDAVRVNRGRLRHESALPTRLLGLGLPLTIVAGTLAALVLLPQLNLWTAAALATMLAPTDAALGLPVVTNPRLPSRIRQGLNVESGLNDGVCVPLLLIFLTIAQAEEGIGHLEPVRVITEEIGVGAAAGVAAGALGAWVLGTLGGRGWMEATWRQINAVATPLLAYTLAAALGGSGFVAAFVAGIVFRILAADHARQATFLAEQTGELLNAVTFLLFGAVLLGPALGELDWPIALYAVAAPTTRPAGSPPKSRWSPARPAPSSARRRCRRACRGWSRSATARPGSPRCCLAGSGWSRSGSAAWSPSCSAGCWGPGSWPATCPA